MEMRFTDGDRLFRAEVRDWLADHLPRQARPLDGAPMRDFDLDWQRRQHEGGWAGIAWPAEYGGRGLTLTQQMIWLEECAHMGAPQLGCLSVALNHAGPTLIARGSEAQKRFHLPKILAGELVWCQGFSEPGAGSDLAGLRTRGVVADDHIAVTGQKIWTSHAHLARYQELVIRTDPALGRHQGLTWIICDMNLPGITIQPIRTLAGHHHFCQVFYEDVRIPLQNVVGAVGDGWRVAMSTLAFERGTGYITNQIHLAHAVEELLALAAELPAPQGGGTALQDAAIATELAQLRAEVAALRAMTFASISRAARQAVPGPEGNMVALAYGELAKRVQRAGMDLLGPLALEKSPAAQKFVQRYLHVFMETIAGGTSEIRRNVIGERVLGLPRPS